MFAVFWNCYFVVVSNKLWTWCQLFLFDSLLSCNVTALPSSCVLHWTQLRYITRSASRVHTHTSALCCLVDQSDNYPALVMDTASPGFSTRRSTNHSYSYFRGLSVNNCKWLEENVAFRSNQHFGSVYGTVTVVIREKSLKNVVPWWRNGQ
jgi:hypothetical protein